MPLYFCIEKNGEDVIGIFKDNKVFNPLTILGDLLHWTRNPMRIDWRAIKEFQNVFGIPYFYNSRQCYDYYKKMCDLRERIQMDTPLRIDELNALKFFYDFTFKLNIAGIEEDGRNIPLKFGLCRSEQFFKRADHEKYFYECFSMIDIPFAILHFLLMNGYKFKRCEHCGKYFATHKTGRSYCTRKSPLKGYEHLKCSEAVKKMMKYLRDKKKQIYINLERHHPEMSQEFLDEFEIFGAVRLEKRAEDLEVLKALTNEEYRKRWYSETKKEKNKKIPEKTIIYLPDWLTVEKAQNIVKNIQLENYILAVNPKSKE